MSNLLKPKYPICVRPTSFRSGDSYCTASLAVLGRVILAMRRAKVPAEEMRDFICECTDGKEDLGAFVPRAFTPRATANDFGRLLSVCLKWVDLQPSFPEMEAAARVDELRRESERADGPTKFLSRSIRAAQLRLKWPMSPWARRWFERFVKYGEQFLAK